MKGLFVKDLKLISLQKNYFFAILAIAIVLTFINDNSTFVLGYLTFVMPMFTLSTISYDEFDNGNAFLFTLPINRKSYVVEKYAFSFLMGAVSWFIALLLTVIFSLMKDATPIVEVLISAVVLFPVMLMICALMIPFQLKFGGEKGRIAIIAAVGLLFIIGFGLVKIAEFLGIDLLNIMNTLSTLSLGMILIIAVVIGLLIYALSMFVSISIMQKKEF